jgi:DNA-binding transcriptional LysR family regulator
MLPGLPRFFAAYPGIELHMSESDRWVDIVREGVDCVLRFGNLPDSDMVARRVTLLERLTCAAPAYLERHGTPTDWQTLEGHRMVGIRSMTTGSLRPLDLLVEGVQRLVTLPITMSVTGPESYLPTVRLGLGIAQLPRFHIEEDLARGTLVALLPEWPPESMPVSILYPRNRQLSPRVRVFIDWLAAEFTGGAGT